MKKFNEWIAVRITNGVATMWCAYFFALLAVVSLPAAITSGNIITIDFWICQNFLQLILLSIIFIYIQVFPLKNRVFPSENIIFVPFLTGGGFFALR